MEGSIIAEKSSFSKDKTPNDRNSWYLKIINRLDVIRDGVDVGLETIKDIGQIISQLNDIETDKSKLQETRRPEETLLDSIALSSASSILVKCVNAVNINIKSYEPIEFNQKLFKFCNNETQIDVNNINSDCLLTLVAEASDIIPLTCRYNSVYGAYDLTVLPQPKQRKERVITQREQLVKKKPEKVVSLDEEEQSIEEIVKEYYTILNTSYQENNEEPIQYFDYVIDTNSFESTVQNMFYCSFLIRDGRVHLDINNKGEPYIKPMTKKLLENFRSNGGLNGQVTGSINYQKWEKYTKEGLLQKMRKKNNH